MPRGRPRKVVVEPTNEQTKKKPIETNQEATINIFSEDIISDISEPSDGPVAEPVIDTIIDDKSTDSDESAHNGQHASIAQTLWDRAIAEIEALNAQRSAIRLQIVSREAFYEDAQADAYATTQSHAQARARLGDIKRQVAIQEQRVALAEGTPAEHEARRELSRLHADLKQAQEAVDDSVKALEDAQNNLETVSALQRASDTDREEIARLDAQADLMETLLQEQKSIRGQEIYDVVKDGIEALEEEVEKRKKEVAIAEEWLKEATEKIPSMLGSWPELADKLNETHGTSLKPIGETSTAKVIRAYMDFIKVLRHERGKVDAKVSGGTVFLVDFLALPRGYIVELLSGENWFKKVTRDSRGRETVEDTTRSLEVAAALLLEQSDRQRGNYKPVAW